MSFLLNAIFSLTIGLSFIIGWTRFKKTDPAFLPFLILVSIAFANEITSLVLALKGYNNIINFNSFQLVESLLLAWQFLRWGFFGKHIKLYYGLQVFFIAAWIAETLFLPMEFDSYFIIAHSFIIVMMSIHTLNGIVVKENTPLYRHPVSLICIGLVVYFTYAILVEAFWIVDFFHQRQFRLKLYAMMSYINLFSNLIFALAFLCIPMKPRYIMQY